MLPEQENVEEGKGKEEANEEGDKKEEAGSPQGKGCCNDAYISYSCLETEVLGGSEFLLVFFLESAIVFFATFAHIFDTLFFFFSSMSLPNYNLTTLAIVLFLFFTS